MQASEYLPTLHTYLPKSNKNSTFWKTTHINNHGKSPKHKELFNGFYFWLFKSEK